MDNIKLTPMEKYRKMKYQKKNQITGCINKILDEFVKEHHRYPISDYESKLMSDQVFQFNEALFYNLTNDEFVEVFKNRQLKYIKRKKRQQNKAIKPQKVKKKHKKKRKPKIIKYDEYEMLQDDTFDYIAGYTSNGVPYGICFDELAHSEVNNDDIENSFLGIDEDDLPF